MTAPRWEVADVIRIVASRFLDSLNRAQQKVLNAIKRCRSAALGGHLHHCAVCGYQEIKYHSCRNRHCPKCQVNAREKWLRKRRQELLPVEYFHIIFSVPHQLIPLMWQNKKLLFSLLFQATGSTLLEVAADHKRLGLEIGFLCILHTWGQTMNKHPHLHCIMPGGGLSLDLTRWISSHPRFFLPVRVLSSVFRDKFLEGLKQAHLTNKLRFYNDCEKFADVNMFAAFIDELSTKKWSAKP
jgi:hypothetical protein